MIIISDMFGRRRWKQILALCSALLVIESSSTLSEEYKIQGSGGWLPSKELGQLGRAIEWQIFLTSPTSSN